MSTTPTDDESFNRGTVAALAVIYIMGHEVCWGEVVRAAGTQQILVHALTNEGDWEWAGFHKLAKSELGASEVANARAKVRRITRAASEIGKQQVKESGDAAE